MDAECRIFVKITRVLFFKQYYTFSVVSVLCFRVNLQDNITNFNLTDGIQRFANEHNSNET